MSDLRLRPFDDADWLGFSGCETLDPLIAESSDPDFFVIIDGNHAEAHRLIDDERALYFAAQFPTKGIALLAAMLLKGDESVGQVKEIWSEYMVEGTGRQDEL